MIRAALLGLGNVAWKYDANNSRSTFPLTQAGAMRAHPDVRLIGGCSPDHCDREGFHTWSEGLPVYADASAMLNELKPQMVGICSPTSAHYTHAEMCLEAGVQLLWLEKPATEHVAETQALIALAKECEATVCVNYFRRYLPIYQNFRKALQDKIYGESRVLRIFYSPGLARNGVHLLDILFFITGAESYELLWVEQPSNSNSPCFALRLSSGQSVQVSGADLPYHTNDITAVCEQGIFSVVRGGKEFIDEKVMENTLFPGFFELCPQKESVLGEADLNNYMTNALNDLVSCFATKQQPLSNLHSAQLTQRLLDDILVEKV